MQDVSHDAIEDVITADRLRRRFIEMSDLDELARLLADDLIHVHAVGYVDDKASYLAGLRERLEVKEVTRPRPAAWMADAVCVMTGPLTNTVRRRGDAEWATGTSFVTQVWKLVDGDWKMALYHATRTAQPQSAALATDGR